MFEDLPVHITSAALAAVQNIRNNKGIPRHYGLRIGVRGGGGCGGVQYMLGFDQPKTDDHIFRLGDIEIYIAKKHFIYLLDLTIDYEETSEGVGFTFSKADATPTTSA